jgi:hypothetical protein
MRRRKVVYAPAKTATKGGGTAAADARAAANANRAVTINLQAIAGRPDIRQGARVRIGSGMYEGELAIVESVGGVIPAAVVRTASGQTRRVRTVDLLPEGASGFAVSDERVPDQP